MLPPPLSAGSPGLDAPARQHGVAPGGSGLLLEGESGERYGLIALLQAQLVGRKPGEITFSLDPFAYHELLRHLEFLLRVGNYDDPQSVRRLYARIARQAGYEVRFSEPSSSPAPSPPPPRRGWRDWRPW